MIEQQTFGLILAGGQSTRMNGVDKGLVELQGIPMISYSISALLPHCPDIIISCNRNKQQYSSIAAACLSSQSTGKDTLPARIDLVDDSSTNIRGPVAGIESFLAYLRDNEPYADDALCVVTTCDMPLVHEEIIAQLVTQLRNSRANLAHFVDSQIHRSASKELFFPFAMRLSAALTLRSNEQFITKQNSNSVFGWLKALGRGTEDCLEISFTWNNSSSSPFENVNDPGSLAKLESYLEKSKRG